MSNQSFPLQRGNKLLLLRSIVLVVSLSVGITILIMSYSNHTLSRKACRELHNGTYSGTTIGNGLSYPLWLHYMMLPLMHGDYLTAEIPLVVACWEGNYDAVCDMLNNGADPNYTYKGYWTAIEATYASPLKHDEKMEQNRLKIAMKLVEYGADIKRYSTGPEAVFEAARFLGCKDTEIEDDIIFLIENGASIVNSDGYTLLHFAAWHNAFSFADVLIERYDVSPDSKSNNGTTPLMLSAQFNSFETASLLIKKGVNMIVEDKTGKTAYDYAIENGHYELAELIKPNSDGVTE